MWLYWSKASVVNLQQTHEVFQLTKHYHFYAAHRNEQMKGKCANIHGHTYYVRVGLRLTRENDNEVTMLFSDIDQQLEPIFEPFDHAFLLDKNDSKAEAIRELAGKVKEFDYPTSAENLARYFYKEVDARMGGLVDYVEVQETTSSVVRYCGP